MYFYTLELLKKEEFYSDQEIFSCCSKLIQAILKFIMIVSCSEVSVIIENFLSALWMQGAVRKFQKQTKFRGSFFVSWWNNGDVVSALDYGQILVGPWSLIHFSSVNKKTTRFHPYLLAENLLTSFWCIYF